MDKMGDLKRLYIGNEIYEYKLKLSKRKSLEIKLNTYGQICVSAPAYMSYKEIELLLRQKSEWINNKLHIIKEKNKESHCSIFTMTNILYEGQDILFEVKEDDINRIRLDFNGKKIKVYIPIGFDDEDRDILIKEYLKKFYKKHSLEYIENKLNYYEAMMGVKVADYKVKDQKTRWGSCSNKGNLNFNLRLSMCPGFVFDYIIVHELCHLIEMNHSGNFWGLVERFYPDYINAKLWLKENSNKIMII